MASSSTKGKGKAVNPLQEEDVSENTFSDQDSDTSTSDESDLNNRSGSEEITLEYLESLLVKAKANIASKMGRDRTTTESDHLEENEIIFIGESDQQPLPVLDPGPSMPLPYFKFGNSRTEPGTLVRDVAVEGIELSAPEEPSAPPAPPELVNGKPSLTKRQLKEQKKSTAGPDWFDLPAPAPGDLPKLYREVEALRLRNALDPKRFYRKEEGERKGIKGLPKYFAVGTIVASSTPFGTASGDNLPKTHRKRTIVDELVDDAEAKRYAKKKFLELQGVRGERGRTLAKKMAARRGRW